MEYVLRTHNLTKKYKSCTAVDDLDISIIQGEIYGFLGQNGAGKTTTLRMVMNLIKPTSGSIELFGEAVTPGNHRVYERVGSIIEMPGFYQNLTAVENLEIQRILMGIQDKKQVDNVMELMGLADVKNRLVREFSLGMKQRLGIARALLHHPELLILDEPTNGLDPIGIKEIRQTILELSRRNGISIIISSHILSEVQQLADKIGIIHKGRLLEEIDFDTLQRKNRHFAQFKVSDDKKASVILEQKLGINDYMISEAGIIRVYEGLENTGLMNRTLVQSGIEIKEITLMRDSLEDYFIRLTGGELSA